LRASVLVAVASVLCASTATADEPAVVSAAPTKGLLADELLLPSYAWDITGAHFSVLRGPALLNDSLTADGLTQALARSPSAAQLAREGHQRLVLGDALYYAGLGGVLVGVVGVTVGAAQVTDSRAQWGFGTAGAVLAAAGLVSLMGGIFAINDGLAKVLEAVNTYNLDLVRGLPATGN